MEVYPTVFEKIILPARDLIAGQKITSIYKFLLKSQYWNRERMDNFINSKLQRLITHAYNNVSYYRSLMKKNAIIPSDIKTVQDLKKFPVLERSVLQEKSKTLLSTDYRIRKIKWAKTSGSSGSQVRYVKDLNTRMWSWACMYRFFSWTGVRLGDRRIDLWGAFNFVKPKYITSKMMQRLWRIKKLSAYKLTEQKATQYIKEIQKYAPHFMRGYASSIFQLARYAARDKIFFSGFKAINTTSDMLTSNMRRLIEETFRCSVFDQYACGEVMGGACECEEHDGMHIAEEHNIIEVNAKDGEVGEILMTDLDNYAMPLIRYKNDDLGVITVSHCRCGRNLRILKDIVGRTEEFIKLTDGRTLNTTFFSPFFSKFPFVRNYKIIQMTKGNIQIIIEGEALREAKVDMEQKLEKMIGSGNTITFQYKSIFTNMKTGKFKIIEKCLK